jgi:hypothetical protein
MTPHQALRRLEKDLETQPEGTSEQQKACLDTLWDLVLTGKVGESDHP